MDISIIVPSLNEENYIKKCLKSIKNQKTNLKYEVILVDGGSKDRTIEYSKPFVQKIVKPKRKGIWFARNAGAKESNGQYLCFVDADTQIPKNYLESTYSIINGDKTIVGLSCAFKFDKKSLKLDKTAQICNNYLGIKGFFGKGEILGFNNLIRRDVFEKVGGFPNEPSEDHGIGINLRKRGRIVFLSEPQVKTSARRITEKGIIQNIIYYGALSIATRIPIKEIKMAAKYEKTKI